MAFAEMTRCRPNEAMDAELSAFATQHRIEKLERENNRLQGLVAELLLKNQQLRDALCIQR